MGIVLVYQTATAYTIPWSALSYYSISLSLNILLTLMIVIRLVLHARNTHTAMGISGIGGLCNAIITMLIESCAIYAVGSSLVIGSWAARNSVMNLFMGILPETQVRALPQPRLSGGCLTLRRLAGYCFASHYSTSRRQECVDERRCRCRTHRFVQSQEPRGADGSWFLSWWGEFCR